MLYKNNKRPLKSNKEDDFIPYDSSDSYDPLVHWSRIGSSLEGKDLPSLHRLCLLTELLDGGLLTWITLGVNTTNSAFTQPPNQKRDVIDWHLDRALDSTIGLTTLLFDETGIPYHHLDSWFKVCLPKSLFGSEGLFRTLYDFSLRYASYLL